MAYRNPNFGRHQYRPTAARQNVRFPHVNVGPSQPYPPPPPPPQPQFFMAPPPPQLPLLAPAVFPVNGQQKLQLEFRPGEQAPPILMPTNFNGGLMMPPPPPPGGWNAGPAQMPVGQFGPAPTAPAGYIVHFALESVVEPGISGSLHKYFHHDTTGVPVSGIPGVPGILPPLLGQPQGQFPPNYGLVPPPGMGMGYHPGPQVPAPAPAPAMPMDYNQFQREKPMRNHNRRAANRGSGMVDFGGYEMSLEYPDRRQNISKIRRPKITRRKENVFTKTNAQEPKPVSDNTVSTTVTSARGKGDPETVEAETGRSTVQQGTTENMEIGLEPVGPLWSSDMEEESKEQVKLELTSSSMDYDEGGDGENGPGPSTNPTKEQEDSDSSRIYKYVKKACVRTSRGVIVDGILAEMQDHGFTHYICGVEFPYVSNKYDYRVYSELNCQSDSKKFTYYVPPRVDDDDFFGGQRQIWQATIIEAFKGFYPDTWTLQGLPEFNKPKQDFWIHYTCTSKLRFCCRSCHRPWTSMRGKIHFAFKYNAQNARGAIFMKIFGQVCIQQVCPDNDFQTPACYPEEILRILENLYQYVGFCYYGHPMNPNLLGGPGGDKCIRNGNPASPHRPDLCQACQQGICSRTSRK